MSEGAYGLISAELARVSAAAVQFSPLIPGAGALEDQSDSAFDRLAILAPQGVLERRYVMAQALRVVKPGGDLLVVAPKDRGGLRLARELGAFGCAVVEAARRHHRICQAKRPAALAAVDQAIEACGPQIPPALGLWSQPGIFSWDRLDPGTALLLRHLPRLTGNGADFGCGAGLIGRAVLANPDVAHLSLVDVDRRAIEASRRNIADPRADFTWQDLRRAEGQAQDLDFVVMNPPFHDGGGEDRALGEIFIRRAASALKPRGVCWLVANRHLPYEQALKTHFPAARLAGQADGYKVYEARR